jgi:hypothetical protein
MVLTVSFALSLVTGLSCHHRKPQCESIVAHLTPASGRQDHTTSPSADCAVRLLGATASTASRTNVRDDRETPPHCGRGTAVLMDVIWVKREGKYFFAKDWTGSISLIGLGKFAVWRNT